MCAGSDRRYDFCASTSGRRGKPAGGTGGGIGDTAGVRTDLQLRRAVLLAARKAQRVLVEALVPGDVHRLLFLDGELLDVIRREPPHVVGDGTASIRDLIARENDRPAAGPGPARGRTAHDDARLRIHARARRRQPALGARHGHRVQVKTTTNHAGPADCHTVRTVLPPGSSNSSAAVRATGLRLAGVDLITTDPTLPLERTGGAVIEVNGNPGLHHHYQVADPARRPACLYPRATPRAPELN